MEGKVTKSSLCRAQDSGAFRHTFAANRSYVDVLQKKALSVERQTKEMFPKQRRLCKQRRSAVASIRSCRARLEVCGTCKVYALYCGLEMACMRSCRARLRVCGTCEEKIIYAKRKKETGIKPSLLIFCFYSFGTSSPAFTAASDAPASAAGASAVAFASVAGATVASSSTTDCCTNCSFSSAVRI